MKTEKKDIKKPEIEQLKKQIEELKNKYLRALADYQNLEKRVEVERTDIRTSVESNLIMKLLPFLDTLEKAEVFVKDEGLKIAKGQLEKTLAELGVREIEVMGREYDPYSAEVIEIMPGVKDNVVTEVIRKGYKMGDKILRVSQVKVTKKT